MTTRPPERASPMRSPLSDRAPDAVTRPEPTRMSSQKRERFINYEDPDAPWCPSWYYPEGPRICPCGHHEGYHAHNGTCLYDKQCGCTGLPVECYTPVPGQPLPRRYTRS